jgi:hypothetical protein
MLREQFWSLRPLIRVVASNLSTSNSREIPIVADLLVRNRCVILIGDYEPTTAAQEFSQQQAGLHKFGQTWNLKVESSPLKIEDGGCVGVWKTQTTAPNWQVNTEFRLLNWSDLIEEDFGSWNLDRIWRLLCAVSNFIVSGTWWRYFRVNWRFALLFLYPLLIALLFIAIALWSAMRLSNLQLPLAIFVGIIIAMGLLAAFAKWVDPFAMPRMARMWIFLYDLVHLERRKLAERLGVFSRDVISKLQSNEFNEVVIIGHGIGAALQLIVMDRALFELPDFGKDGRSVCLLSLGSLLLSVGLHSEGAWLVPPISRIANDRMVYWVEYQAADDILSFPGRSPVAELLGERSKPILQEVRIKEMSDRSAKPRFPEAIFHDHLQFVRANAKKYFYDYFMICCGPIALPVRVEHPNHMIKVFGPDGSLIPGR